MKTPQKFKHLRRYTWLLFAAGALVAFAGCSDDDHEGLPGLDGDTVDHRLTLATSCDDVRENLANSLTAQALDSMYGYVYYYDIGFDDRMNGDLEDAAGAPEAGSGEDSAEPDDFTDTNVQEEGVDEPDIVKTDGTHIYTVVDGSLRILQSWPPEDTAPVGRFQFSSQINPISLFLDGDRAIVLSRQHQHHYYDHGPRPDEGAAPGSGTSSPGGADEEELEFGGTRVSIIDVADPTEPSLVRQFEVEGNFVDARKIDGTVYLVSNSHLNALSWWNYRDDERLGDLPERDWEEDEEELEEMRAEALPILKEFFLDELASMDPADWLPRQRISDADGELLEAGSLYGCTDLYLPAYTSPIGALNITSLDVDDQATLATTALLADGWLVYSSQDNLYVAKTSRSWWWGPWGMMGNQSNESHIHKFKLHGSDEPEYRASGRVDGWILNQFSMSEYEGHLRVATTDNRWDWDDETGEATDDGGNHMIILKREDNELVETGSVRDIAPTEQIYSARFMGDRAFMVTFFIVDPFYTFDLSDPNDPKLLGELKIPGYSSYMHPIGDDHLLAIGQDGTDDGMMTGVHLQVFDVTDMLNPERTHHHVISTGSWSSWSEAMHDHRAFTYQADLGVLAVPVTIWEDDDYFSGLILFEADKDGIDEIGRIDHSNLMAQKWCNDQGQIYGEDCDSDPHHFWWYSWMRRSIIMTGSEGAYVYSLSDVGLMVNDVFDVTTDFASVLFE